MEMARLSARCAECRWGLLVSGSVRALAREGRKRNPRVGLLGLIGCWARFWPRGLFLLFKSFLFLFLFSVMVFDMNSNPFESKLFWGFLQGFVDSKTVILTKWLLCKAWSSLGFKVNKDLL